MKFSLEITMKTDLSVLPKVKDVYIAIVKEFNDTHKTEDWNVYIINDKDYKLRGISLANSAQISQ